MKVIQSFAQHTDGSPYCLSDDNVIYLNYYTYLLSYLTLKKYYGSVTMYCNDLAYNTIIKYIPYDEVIHMKNENGFKRWNLYKIQAIKNTVGDVVHVDSDVFLFNDLLAPFRDGKCDGIVQDRLIPRVNYNFSNSFIVNNKTYLTQNNIFDCGIYDGSCYSCGVLGMTSELKEKYLKMVQQLDSKEQEFNLNGIFFPAILEELGFYLTVKKYKANVHEILPNEEILKHRGDPKHVGTKYGYTHMWFKTKYVRKNVELIKNKIKKDFNEHYHLVEAYDELISGYNVMYIG